MTASMQYDIDMLNFSHLLPSRFIAGDYAQFQHHFRNISPASQSQLHRLKIVRFFKCEFCQRQDIMYNPELAIQNYQPEFQNYGFL